MSLSQHRLWLCEENWVNSLSICGGKKDCSNIGTDFVPTLKRCSESLHALFIQWQLLEKRQELKIARTRVLLEGSGQEMIEAYAR